MDEQRNASGFYQIGKANDVSIYASTERANASESKKRLLKNKLSLATYQLLLSAFSTDSSLRGKFNDNGKTDTSFWIDGIGKDTNHLVTESQKVEITPSQETEALKLAESGMKYQDIAEKLGVPAVGVYYTLKKGSNGIMKSKKPRSSALFTFDKKGNLIEGKGDSLENTVRVSIGSDNDPILFFILRDSYSRVGGARFVIAACNGRQFTPDTKARIIVGVPQE